MRHGKAPPQTAVVDGIEAEEVPLLVGDLGTKLAVESEERDARTVVAIAVLVLEQVGKVRIASARLVDRDVGRIVRDRDGVKLIALAVAELSTVDL